MKRLRAFFRTIWLSLTSIPHYQNALTLKTSAGIKYLYGLFALLALAGGIVAAIAMMLFVPTAERGVANLQATLPMLYPPELVVTLSGGLVSTNVPEPYAIPFPAQWKAFMEDKDAAPDADDHPPANLVVIDTTASAEDYLAANTVLLVTKRAVVYPRQIRSSTSLSTGKTERHVEVAFRTLENEKDQVITQETYDNLMAAVLPLGDMVPAILYTMAGLLAFLLPFLGAAALLAWHLLYLFIASAILWVIARLMGRTLKYGEVYRLALYGITVPLLYSILAALLHIDLPGIPDFTIVFAVWMAYVFSRLPRISDVPLKA